MPLLGAVRYRQAMKSILSHAAVAIAFLLVGLGISRSQQAAQSQRFPQFENDAVKVWRTIVMPNAPLVLHRHEHPRVIIPLRGGTMKIAEKDGPAETDVWETGKAYWLTANRPNSMHTDVNAGAKPIEVMVVELLHEK